MAEQEPRKVQELVQQGLKDLQLLKVKLYLRLEWWLKVSVWLTNPIASNRHRPVLPN